MAISRSPDNFSYVKAVKSYHCIVYHVHGHSTRRVSADLDFKLSFHNCIKSKYFSIYCIKLITEYPSVAPLNAKIRAALTLFGSFNYPGWLYDAANRDD